MALRIRPLSEGPSGGLTIRPLDEVLASFAAPAASAPSTPSQPATPEGTYSDFKRQAPAQQMSQFSDVGGNGEGSIGASLGFGLNGSPTAGEVGFAFGQLAGPSPPAAALAGLSPTLASALGIGPNLSGTPAGLIGSIFGSIPGLGPMGAIPGVVSATMQQAAINQAMQTPEGVRGFLASNPIALGIQGGPRGGNDTEGLTDTDIPGITGTPGFSDDPGAPGITGDPGDGPGVGVGTAGEGSAGDAGGPGAFHTGGSVGKGAPKGPERKAKLLEGEFVVRKEAAQAHRPLLEAINRGEPPKKLRKLLDYLMEPTEEKAKA